MRIIAAIVRPRKTSRDSTWCAATFGGVAPIGDTVLVALGITMLRRGGPTSADLDLDARLSLRWRIMASGALGAESASAILTQAAIRRAGVGYLIVAMLLARRVCSSSESSS